jgi:hypothetical protein
MCAFKVPLLGRIGKSGESPARTRHCNGKPLKKATGKLGRLKAAMNRSQETCLGR